MSVERWDAANAVKGPAPARGDGEGRCWPASCVVPAAGTREPRVTNGGSRNESLLTYRCRRHHGAGRRAASCAIKRETIEEYVEACP